MRKLISVTMMGVLAMGLGIGISGCSDESSTKKKYDGQDARTATTTVTDKTTVNESGENPAGAARPPDRSRSPATI